MKKLPRMKLTRMWQEVALPVKEEPNVQVASVLRMDAEVLVLDTKAQSGVFAGLCVFAMLLALIFLPLMSWKEPPSLFSPPEAISSPGESWSTEVWFFMAVTWFTTLASVAAVLLAAFVLWHAFVVPAPSPIVFNRRTRKIYGSHRGRPVELDWERIRPVLTQGLLLAAGVQRFYNLVLFQPDSTHDWLHSRIKRGVGLVVTAGHPWGWGTCHQLWEFIRRYMDEDPKQAAMRLPKVEIASSREGWIAQVLDQGPYYDGTEAGARMQRLRTRRGMPEIGWLNTVMMMFLSPAALMSILMVFCRRKMQMPARWWPDPAKGPNSYSLARPSPEDDAFRRKAASIVALWLMATVIIGCGLWLQLVLWVTHLT